MANLNLNYKGFETYLIKRKTEVFDSIFRGKFEGVQYRFKFDNGYGASVIKQYGSYGYKEDLWELAVIFFRNPDDPEDYELTYNTPIARDVIGHLTDDRVREILGKIKELPD